MRQQMVLGDFIFGLSRGFAYSSLIRTSDGGWSDLVIIASKPQSRQSGQKLEKLTFNGTAIYATGMQRLDELRALQNTRAPLPLVDGIGRNWGLWRINSVVETQSNVIDDGAAMVMAWTLELEDSSMRRVRSIAGDSVNLLLYRELGRCDDAAEETLWRLNRELAEYGPVLPAGVWVVVPEMHARPGAVRPVLAWD